MEYNFQMSRLFSFFEGSLTLKYLLIRTLREKDALRQKKANLSWILENNTQNVLQEYKKSFT